MRVDSDNASPSGIAYFAPEHPSSVCQQSPQHHHQRGWQLMYPQHIHKCWPKTNDLPHHASRCTRPHHHACVPGKHTGNSEASVTYLRWRHTTYMLYRMTISRRKHSSKAPTLTPYYIYASCNHQQQERPQPRGTYVDIISRTRHTRPAGG